LVLAVQKEKNPQEKMELLRRWEQEYPDSEFKSQRLIQMAKTDGEIVTKWLLYGGSTAEMDAAKNAATDLLNNLDRYLAPENKPPGASDDQWNQARQKLETQARAALKS
jgi:hypothetical protein